MNHRNHAQHIASVLTEYAEIMQGAFDAEHYGNPAAARNHRSHANRVLLDADPPVRVPGLIVNPTTGEVV